MVAKHVMGKAITDAIETKTWFEAAFESLPISALIIDKDAQITTVNERACVLIGVSCANIKGRYIGEMFGRIDSDGIVSKGLPLEQVFQLGLTFSSDEIVFQGTLVKKLGRFSLLIVPMWSAERSVIGAVVTIGLASKNTPLVEMSVFPEMRPADAAVWPNKSLYVRNGGRYVRVLFSELLYVEAMENYVQLQTTQEKFVIHATLKSIYEALIDNGFQRIHRSFIVKKDEIERIEENHVVVRGVALPIGKSFRSELLEGLTLL